MDAERGEEFINILDKLQSAALNVAHFESLAGGPYKQMMDIVGAYQVDLPSDEVVNSFAWIIAKNIDDPLIVVAIYRDMISIRNTKKLSQFAVKHNMHTLICNRYNNATGEYDGSLKKGLIRQKLNCNRFKSTTISGQIQRLQTQYSPFKYKGSFLQRKITRLQEIDIKNNIAINSAIVDKLNYKLTTIFKNATTNS